MTNWQNLRNNRRIITWEKWSHWNGRLGWSVGQYKLAGGEWIDWKNFDQFVYEKNGEKLIGTHNTHTHTHYTSIYV